MAVRYKRLMVVSDRRVDSLTSARIREYYPGYKREPKRYTKTFLLMEGEDMKMMVRTNIIMTQCDAIVHNNCELFRDEMLRDILYYLSSTIGENVTTNYRVANSFNFRLHIYVPTELGIDLKWWKDNTLYMEWDEPEQTSVTQLGVPYPEDMTKFTVSFRFKEGMFMVKRKKSAPSPPTPLKIPKDRFFIERTVQPPVKETVEPPLKKPTEPPVTEKPEQNIPRSTFGYPSTRKPEEKKESTFGYPATKKPEEKKESTFGYPATKEPKEKRFGNIPSTFGEPKKFIPEKDSGFKPNFSSADKFHNTGSIGNFGRWAKS